MEGKGTPHLMGPWSLRMKSRTDASSRMAKDRSLQGIKVIDRIEEGTTDCRTLEYAQTGRSPVRTKFELFEPVGRFLSGQKQAKFGVR